MQERGCTPVGRHSAEKMNTRELRRAYAVLRENYDRLLKQYEELLRERMEHPGQTTWGRANEDMEQTVPVITGLDPDKAFALTRNVGLHQGPSGLWGEMA